ncbi:Gamma-aminobutyric acid (GABA) B receptor [Seminavis robusta]|uniref:Gamma-aminobutyric acid (GABA) B receptor n=1 Tax=Seminavis robusta TaxID=568900 RepID=A0A9N8EDK9_9STRA|nr:Gamma-aminobutyric acid (GABA) B receptor [Seminavis robusta]|eukprot:Sro935_g221980.1 Gamma-aminobutyric acid (GABA) B receptor (1111) ;mRNA; r:15594-19707
MWRMNLLPTSVLAFVTAASLLLLRPTEAAIACNASYNPCELLLYSGSQCRNGFCTNPFESGCLTTLLREEFKANNNTDALLPSLARRLSRDKRVCNSDDPPDARGIVCVDHTQEHFGLWNDYMEVRILSQNWESAFFASWILQILLSEVLRVPTTLETGVANKGVNFYSATNDFDYGKSNLWSAIETANANGDCTKLHNDNDNDTADDYVPCGHVIPEFWGGNNLKDLWSNHREGIVDAPEGLGAIGTQGLFVTKFTAETDPTVLNLLGIAGEENRRKLAETFLRPTTWGEYCNLVSNTTCATPDGVAQRAPTEEEVDRMHVPGLYTGYFRATEENDCDTYPDTCTGHVADFPCGWSSYVGPQTHHHNIALQSSGKEPGARGYSYSQLVEMYAAANATKSNLMTMWWTPEAMYSTYLGTSAEMQKVILPSPTQECVDHRIRSSQRCEFETSQEQYGDKRGACDEAPQLLQKIVGSGLYQRTYESGIDPAKQSPAYEAVKAFQLSELQIGTILQQWINRNQDRYGFDPRHATCMWLRENLEYLEDFIPRQFPRVGHEQNILEAPLFYAAIALGTLATLMTIVVTVLTYRRRNGYVMRFSQVEFLFLLLLGLLFVSVGSILLAIPPSNGSCVAISWLVGLGYTLELVPLIVKVAAINRLMSAAKKFKRVVLTQQQLFGTVAMFTSIMVVFLVLWSAIDTPERQGEYTLTDETTEDGEHIVIVGYYCKSNSDAWRYLAVLWHCILLICATVLAFQTRNLQAGFSESTVLAMMIYSHFVFVMLRVISFLLEGTISESYMAGLRSLIYSSDAIVTMCVYFVPKLLKDDDKFYALTHTPRGGVAFGRSVVSVGNSVLVQQNNGSGGSSSALIVPPPKQLSKPEKVGETDELEDSVIDPEAIIEPLTASTVYSATGHTSATGHSVGFHNSGHNSGSSMKSAMSKPKAKEKKDKKDVLGDNKVSWGGINISEWVRSTAKDSEESTGTEDDYHNNDQEKAPFEKPVDVLKENRDSWGGQHVTLLIHSEEDHSNHDDGEESAMKPCMESTEDDGISSVASSKPQSRKSLLPPSKLPSAGTSRFSYCSSRINRTRSIHTAASPEMEMTETFHDEDDKTHKS